MSGRSRERGSRFETIVTGQGSFSLQRKRVGGQSPNWVYETREVDDSGNDSSYFDDRETMTDVIGCRGNFNPCTHVKRHQMPLLPHKASLENWPLPTQTPPTDWHAVGGNAGSYQSSISVHGLYPDGNALPTSGFPDVDWSNLVDQVGSQLDGRMQTGQNLLVSLVQLPQAIGMLKNPFNLKRLSKLKFKKPLGVLLKTPANAYLEYLYGWKNLERDIRALANVFQEVRRHKDYLSKTAYQYASCSCSIEDTVPNSSHVGTLSFGSGNGWSISIDRTHDVRKCSFSLDVRRTQSALLWSSLDLAYQRLGLGDIVTALWDLIPFSFVVDWFIHVDRFLGKDSINWSTHDLRRIGYSIKYETYCVAKYYANISSYWGPESFEFQDPPFCVQTVYNRYSGFPPNTYGVGLFGSLNKTQIAAGLALIVQKL